MLDPKADQQVKGHDEETGNWSTTTIRDDGKVSVVFGSDGSQDHGHAVYKYDPDPDPNDDDANSLVYFRSSNGRVVYNDDDE